jgi:hypothetical protein
VNVDGGIYRQILLGFVAVHAGTPVPLIVVMLVTNGAPGQSASAATTRSSSSTYRRGSPTAPTPCPRPCSSWRPAPGIAVTALLVLRAIALAEHTLGDPSVGYRWAPRGMSASYSWRCRRDEVGHHPIDRCGERGKRPDLFPLVDPPGRQRVASSSLSRPGPGGAVVVVRGRKSRPHGEGRQRVRNDGTGR